MGKGREEKSRGAVAEAAREAAEVRAERLVEVCSYLRDDADLAFSFLACLTAVDRLERLEVVYHLQSIKHNRLTVLKVSTADRDSPEVPSVVGVWRGALLQEREAYDLMGIRFAGHPDMRRGFRWGGCAGHPLRKDWLNRPGGLMAGLERFPGEPGGKLEGRG